MDFGLLLGLILGLSCIFGAFLMEGGVLSAVVQTPAMLIVFGGMSAVALISLPGRKLLNMWRLPWVAMRSPLQTPTSLIRELVEACETARRTGLLSLEGEISELQMPFTRKYMRMFINGTDPQLLRDFAESEINYISERHDSGASLMSKIGGYAPTMGIIGTVLGLITTLASAGGNPEQLIHNIATAFIATLWGVFMANVIFLPLSDKLRHRHQEEVILYEMALEGIMTIQAGFSPRVVRQRLLAMLPKSQEILGQLPAARSSGGFFSSA